jgi:hypothetical protein
MTFPTEKGIDAFLTFVNPMMSSTGAILAAPL